MNADALIPRVMEILTNTSNERLKTLALKLCGKMINEGFGKTDVCDESVQGFLVYLGIDTARSDRRYS